MQMQSNDLGQARGHSAAALCAAAGGKKCCGREGTDCIERADRSCPRSSYLCLIVSATSGTFAILYNGLTTGPLAYDVDNATLQSAVEGLDPSFAGLTTVASGAGVPCTYRITFDETVGDVAAGFTFDGAGLAPGVLFGGQGYDGAGITTSFWKVELVGVGTGTTQTFTDGGFDFIIETHGDVNRTYYVNGYEAYNSATDAYDFVVLTSKFFTDATSSNAGYGSSTSVDGEAKDAQWLFFNGGIAKKAGGDVDDRYFFAEWNYNNPEIFRSDENDVDPTACGAATETDNVFDTYDNDTYGVGGFIRATPCPECPKTVTAPTCMRVTLESGTCDDVAGDYIFEKFYRDFVDNSEQPSFATLAMNPLCGGYYSSKPAGCVWVWGKSTASDAIQKLYVWWDGQDWRAMIGRLLSFQGNSATCASGSGQAFYVAVELVNEADWLISDSTGTFVGQALLKTTTPGDGDTPFLPGGCASTIVKIQTGCENCPTDCTESCPRVEFLIENFTDPEDSWVSVEKNTLSGGYPAECIFTTTGGRLECISGEWVLTYDGSVFSSPDDPRGGKWTAPVDPDHPTRVPGDPASWTRIYGSQFGGDLMDILDVRFREGGVDFETPCTPP